MTEPVTQPLNASDLAELERLEGEAGPMWPICSKWNGSTKVHSEEVRRELWQALLAIRSAFPRLLATVRELKDENERLKKLTEDLAGRVAGQSELIASRAKKQPLEESHER